MSRRILVWRHGRTEWNALGFAQGQTDVPLDETGVRQAKEAAPQVGRYRPARIVSSDLSRARDTAAALGEVCGLPVVTDARLREFHLGEREGLTTAQTYERFGAQMAKWVAAQEARFGDSETLAEAAVRFAAALDDIAGLTADGEVSVVVGHGGSMRVGMLHWLGIPQSMWGRFGGFGNCRWAVLHEQPVRPGHWRLADWNAGAEPERCDAGQAAHEASSSGRGDTPVNADDV